MAENTKIRQLDATIPKEWCPAGKGQTPDAGAGSRAKTCMAEVQDWTEADKAYAEVVAAIKKLPEVQQRAIGFAVASNYSWESLKKKAKETAETAKVPSLDDRAKAEIEKMPGSKKWTLEKALTEFLKKKAELKAADAEMRAAKKTKAEEETKAAKK